MQQRTAKERGNFCLLRWGENTRSYHQTGTVGKERGEKRQLTKKACDKRALPVGRFLNPFFFLLFLFHLRYASLRLASSMLVSHSRASSRQEAKQSRTKQRKAGRPARGRGFDEQ